MTKIFLSRAVLFEPGGRQTEMNIMPESQGFSSMAEEYGDTFALARLIDPVMRKIDPFSADMMQGIAGLDAHISNEGNFFIPSGPTDGLWNSVESLVDEGDNPAATARAALMALQKEVGPETIYAEYEEPLSLWEKFTAAVSDQAPPERKFVPLTPGIESRIANGEIKNATLTTSNPLIDSVLNTNSTPTSLNPNNIGHRIEIKDGKVVSMINGWEDQIPQTVLDFARDTAAANEMPLAVQTILSKSGPEYQLVDSDGKPVVLDIKVDPNGALLPTMLSNRDTINLPNVPNASGGSGNVVSTGETHTIVNEGTPELPKPQVVYIEPYNFKLSEENPLLSIDNSQRLPQQETYRLQAALSKLGSLNSEVGIDLGSHTLSAEEHNRLFNNGEKALPESPPGVDGLFGPRTEASVIAAQRYLWPNDQSKHTGVADQTFINALDKEIEALQKAPHAGKFVEYNYYGVKPNEIQTPAAAASTPEAPANIPPSSP